MIASSGSVAVSWLAPNLGYEPEGGGGLTRSIAGLRGAGCGQAGPSAVGVSPSAPVSGGSPLRGSRFLYFPGRRGSTVRPKLVERARERGSAMNVTLRSERVVSDENVKMETGKSFVERGRLLDAFGGPAGGFPFRLPFASSSCSFTRKRTILPFRPGGLGSSMRCGWGSSAFTSLIRRNDEPDRDVPGRAIHARARGAGGRRVFRRRGRSRVRPLHAPSGISASTSFARRTSDSCHPW